MSAIDLQIESDPPKKIMRAQRRYDVDWLRTIALALLIIYHSVLCFQPWAKFIGFPQNDQTMEWIWILMAGINIWRIPILFLISGMGLRFAMERRDWKQLLADRTVRILVPYIFGIFIMQAVVSFSLPYLGWQADFSITFGHLWFLLNIYLYVVCLLGIWIYFKDHPDNVLFRFFRNLISRPAGLLLLAIPIMFETWLVDPQYFSTYVDTLHGWLIGLICFITGFLLISVQDVFWPAVKKLRWITLMFAFVLYILRVFIFQEAMLKWIIAFESVNWMLSLFGFCSLYINRYSRSLSYFSKAVYPVYIFHLPVQFTIAYFLFNVEQTAPFKLFVLLTGTFLISLLLYEIFRQLKWIRPLFGMKWNQD